MLSIGAMGSGQGSYYVGLAAEDYYIAGGEPPGRWVGEGAAALGLSGQVDRTAFLNVFAGFDAKGAPLVQNAGADNRQPGWDLTFSAPKSVSTIWAIADTETRQAIQAAHFAALKNALSFLEDGSTTRRGKGGEVKEAARLVIATFEHGTSRAQDPQLHTHALVLNLGVRADGTTGTLESQGYYRSKMAAGALYRAELSRLLMGMGFEIERDKTSFEIKGVPKALLEEFSKRRAEIEARLQEQGKDSARAAATAALDTRQVKEHRARQELFHEWQEVGRSHSFTIQEAQGLKMFAATRGTVVEMEEALATAIGKISQDKSHFGARDLLRATAEEAQGRGLSATEIRAAVKVELQKPEFIFLGEHKGETRYTTRELWQIEQELLKTADALCQDDRHRASHRNYLYGMLKAEERAAQAARSKDPEAPASRMSDEQREALAHITKEAGAVALVSGLAGTGKTFLLDAAREVWEAQGFTVIGAAIAGKAARGLEDGAGIKSGTIAKFLHPSNRAALDEKTVLVIDEAGMVGTRQMAALIKRAQDTGAKVVLVGDARQLQAIEVGGAFHSIQRRQGAAELSKIIRQRYQWQRDAVKDFAEGRAARALQAYREQGCFTVAETRDAAKGALIESWKTGGITAPAKNVIFTGTRVEAKELNRKAQNERQRARKLGFRSLRVGGETIHERDRVLFTENSRVLGVENGSTGTVTAVDVRAQALTVRLDGGRETVVPCRAYQNITLGYALTTHKGQGMTVENAFILCGGSMADREISYVQASRAKERTEFFTEKIMVWNPFTQKREEATMSELAQQMSQSRRKELAHDVPSIPVLPQLRPYF